MADGDCRDRGNAEDILLRISYDVRITSASVAIIEATCADSK